MERPLNHRSSPEAEVSSPIEIKSKEHFQDGWIERSGGNRTFTVVPLPTSGRACHEQPRDAYLVTYNTKRPHQGRNMNGRTPAKAFIEGLPKPSKKEEKTTQKAA